MARPGCRGGAPAWRGVAALLGALAAAAWAVVGQAANADSGNLTYTEAVDSDDDNNTATSTSTTSATSTQTSTTTTRTSTVTGTTTTTTYDRFKEEPFCSEELLGAVLRGETTEVRRYVVLSQDLNCKTDFEYLLQLVLRTNRREMSELIAASLPPGCNHTTAPNSTGATPLLQAADKGYTKVVESLIVRGQVEVSVKDKFTNNVLHLAAPWPETSAAILRLIPGYKAAPLLAARDAAGNQPVHRAFRAWTDVAAASKAAMAILEGAASKNTEEWAQISMKTLVNEAGKGGNRPAHLTSDLATLKRLSGWGANFGRTALNDDRALPYHTVAAANGSGTSGALAFVARFLNVSNATASGRRLQSSSVDLRDKYQRTALHYAAGGGDPSNVRWLIDSGADPSLVDVNGDSPLAYGLRANQRQLVMTFAEYGGNPLTAIVRVGRLDILLDMVNQSNRSLSIDQRDTKTGRTAVFDAAEFGEIKILQLFIELGANLSHVDNNGYSVLAAAVNAHQVESARTLMGSGADSMQVLSNGTTALHVASAAGCGPCVDVLVVEGSADVDARDAAGMTPLHRCGSRAAAEALIRLDALSLSTPDHGLYPEHTAAFNGRDEVLSVLFEQRHSADNGVDIRSNSGDTPLHLAAAGGHAPVIQLLLRWCAAVEATNRDGGTPRAYAATTKAWSLLRDAAAVPGRCQCDCGPYLPSAMYSTSNWRPGCTATVQCARSQLGGGAEEVYCRRVEAPVDVPLDASNATNATNATRVLASWTPAAPTFACSRVASGSPRRAGAPLALAALAAAASVLATWVLPPALASAQAA